MKQAETSVFVPRRSPVPPIALLPILLLVLASIFSGTARADTVDGWPVSGRHYDREKMKSLDEAIANETFRQINSVVVIRDGELLIERYYNGSDRDSTHDPRSVGKTFAGAVLGIAIEEGFIKGVDQTLSGYYDLDAYANPSPKKAAVTLRELITMTSGFDGFDFDMDSPGNEEYMYPEPNWVAWTLNLPMAADRDPGEEWRYFTAGIVLLGDILNRNVPGGLEAYAHDRLFGRLGISDYEWQHTPQKVANTGGGIRLRPLDFARFGQLYLDGGLWHGERIVPEAWVATSLEPLVQTTEPGNRYGYLWWHKEYELDGEMLPTSYCSGNGGNKIFVFGPQRMVVVVTASAYNQRYAHGQIDRMMTEYILPAVLRAD